MRTQQRCGVYSQKVWIRTPYFWLVCLCACIAAEHSRMTTAPVKRWRTHCLWERAGTEGCLTWTINPGDRAALIISAGLYREECEYFLPFISLLHNKTWNEWCGSVQQGFQGNICSLWWPCKEKNDCDLGFVFDLLMPTYFPEMWYKPFFMENMPIICQILGVLTYCSYFSAW